MRTCDSSELFPIAHLKYIKVHQYKQTVQVLQKKCLPPLHTNTFKQKPEATDFLKTLLSTALCSITTQQALM